jgi:hypothetical protein
MIHRTPWTHLVTLEPRLAGLERRARACAGSGNWHDWEGIKRQLQQLVGWNARNPELGSSEAFDVAYRYLLGIWEGAE